MLNEKITKYVLGKIYVYTISRCVYRTATNRSCGVASPYRRYTYSFFSLLRLWNFLRSVYAFYVVYSSCRLSIVSRSPYAYRRLENPLPETSPIYQPGTVGPELIFGCPSLRAGKNGGEPRPYSPTSLRLVVLIFIH